MADVLPSPAETLVRAVPQVLIGHLLERVGWRRLGSVWRSPDGQSRCKPYLLTRGGRRHGVFLQRSGLKDQPLDAIGIVINLWGRSSREAIEIVRSLVETCGPAGQMASNDAPAPSDPHTRWPGLTPPPAVGEVARRMTTQGPVIDVAALDWAVTGERDKVLVAQLRAIRGVVRVDGRARVRWLPSAQASGRWSCVPDLRVAPRFRHLVVAAPGHLLVEADIVAADAGAVACLTRDPTLVACCQHCDPWQAIRQLFAWNDLQLDRDHTKGAFNRWIGGMSVQRLRAYTGSADVCTRLVTSFPKVVSWFEWVAATIGRSDPIYVPTSTRWLDSRGCNVGQLAARQSQLLVADHVDRALVALDAQFTGWGDDPKIIANLHDGLLIEAPEAAVTRVADAVRCQLESEVFAEALVRFRTRIRAGRSWGSMVMLHESAHG